MHKLTSKRPHNALLIAIIIMLCVTLIVLGYLFFQYKTLSSATNDPERIIKKVSRILLVDQNVTPRVEKAQDIAELKDANKEFYVNVQEGDYLLLYPNRFIIYREQDNQIINIAPIIQNSAE